MESNTANTGEVTGYIDHLTDELTVAGWAWRPATPDDRLEVEFLINGTPAGWTTASLYRLDVAQAGHGDGHYGFSWTLRLDDLPQADEIVISARAGEGALLSPLTLAAKPLATRIAAFAAGAPPAKKLSALRAATRLAPDEPWHVLALADALRAAGETEQASSLLHGLLTAQPAFWHAHVALGHLARGAGRFEAALSWFAQAAALAPEDAWRWLELAEHLRSMNRYDEAQSALGRAAAAAPGLWAVALEQAYLARVQGEHELARQHFETAARLAPEKLEPHLGQIDELRDAGALDQAREAACGLLAAHPGNMALLLSLAYTEREAGRPEEAAEYFAQALAQEPDNPTLLAELAREKFRLGHQQESHAYLTRALALDPFHSDAISQRAAQALAAGDAAQAFEIYHAAAMQRPAEPAFRFGMLDTLAWQGKLEEALAGLQAMELEHGNSPQLQSWRITLLRRAGLMDEALRAARAATAAAPQQFWLWVERFQTELLSGTDAMLQKSLFGIPAGTRAERAVRRRCIGALAESLWQMDAALSHYEAAAELAPHDISLQEALARVKMMRFDLEGANGHLTRQYQLMAAERQLRGESPNISQSLLGQVIQEYAMDEEAAIQLAALSAQPAIERLEQLAALVLETPDNTAPAASLLLALRQAELLGFTPAPEGSAAIPRSINCFWDRPEPPADIEALMQSWAEHNPHYNWRRFNQAQAQDYLAARFPGPVLQAYQRVREATQKADIFRLALLVAEGGVYVDADDRCLRPLDRLLPPGASLVLAQEEFGCAANHFLAAAPGHPVLQSALRAVVTALNRGDNEIPWLLSGPGLITRALAQHLAARGITAGLPPGLALLDKRELGRATAAACHAAYKMRNHQHSNAAAPLRSAG